MKRVDVNCDMGEGFPYDEELMRYITSANIACGFHAGDPTIMNETVLLAKKHGTAVGAHPGYPDLEGFGRRDMHFTPHEIYHSVVYQVGALEAFCNIHGVEINHVKPHGALYNRAAKDKKVADAIARAVYDVGSALILYGLAGSELISAGRANGLQVASEVFADRTYQADGTLTPRGNADAMVVGVDNVVQRIRTMLDHNYVEAVDGSHVTLQADTICVHGDGEHAVDFVKTLRGELVKEGIDVRAIRKVCDE